MKTLVGLLLLLLTSLGGFAEPGKLGPMEVESSWRGVNMKVDEIRRISGDRLLVLVRLTATAAASQSTTIGTEVATPAKVTPEELASGLYTPGAFSLANAVMTDELTGKTYSVAKPDPKDINYAPSAIMSQLRRGDFLMLAIRFQSPPAPGPGPDGQVPKQTVSLLLPKAKAPISKIPLPPASS